MVLVVHKMKSLRWMLRCDGLWLWRAPSGGRSATERVVLAISKVQGRISSGFLSVHHGAGLCCVPLVAHSSLSLTALCVLELGKILICLFALVLALFILDGWFHLINACSYCTFWHTPVQYRRAERDSYRWTNTPACVTPIRTWHVRKRSNMRSTRQWRRAPKTWD